MAVVFSTDTDDSGAGVDGTIHNNAWKQAMATAINTAHGDWTAITFVAGNFTGNGSMTWTLASGDVLRNRYRVTNKTLHWICDLVTTSVGGTPNTSLQIAIPTGTFASLSQHDKVAYANDNGTLREALVVPMSTTVLGIQLTSAANWAASTNLTYVYFSIALELA